MCENLDVYNFYYQTSKELVYLGTSQKNSFDIPYNSAWKTINAAWKTSNIARKKGIDNLSDQGEAAIKLISQLETTPETTKLNDRVIEILGRIDKYSTNYGTIEQAAIAEAQERARKVAAGQIKIQQELQLAQGKANVQVAQQQASALWYGHKWNWNTA